MEIKANTIAEAWPRFLQAIFDKHNIVPIKSDGKIVYTVELNEPMMVRIRNQTDGRIPEGSKWTNETALNKYVIDVIRNNDTGFEYTYGERLRSFHGFYDQLTYVICNLMRDKNNRQSVCNLWDVRKDINSNHPPCLMICDYSIREGLLYSIYYIRSNDIFGAWPENAYLFTELNKYIAKYLNVQLGYLNIVSNKAHIYEYDLGDVMEVLDTPLDVAHNLMSEIVTERIKESNRVCLR